MHWLTNWNIWLIVGLILLILESILPGIYLMWWGIAAIILGGLVVIFEPSLTWQLILFAILAVGASILDWCYQRNKDQQQDKKSHLNQRNKAMLGKEGRVVDILDNGAIRAQFGDTTWKVEGPDLSIGDYIKVMHVEGITLIVKKIKQD